jgi:hypothetical protein
MTESAAAIHSSSDFAARFVPLLALWREHVLAEWASLRTGMLAALAGLLVAWLIQILLIGGWRIGQADVRLS